jgi:hypothetical protein
VRASRPEQVEEAEYEIGGHTALTRAM